MRRKIGYIASTIVLVGTLACGSREEATGLGSETQGLVPPSTKALDYAHVELPRAGSDALARASTSLKLSDIEQRKAQGIFGDFEIGQRILEHYPEPLRSEKRLALKRQFALTMRAALPRVNEGALAVYLQGSLASAQ